MSSGEPIGDGQVGWLDAKSFRRHTDRDRCTTPLLSEAFHEIVMRVFPGQTIDSRLRDVLPSLYILLLFNTLYIQPEASNAPQLFWL